jgi:hypothetical protein
LFAAGIIFLVEKIFLRFVAINFHQKALSERLAENRLALEALDRLSNAHPQPAAARKNRNMNKGHGQKSSELSQGLDNYEGNSSPDSNITIPEKVVSTIKPARSTHTQRKQKRKSIMTSIIVDQVGGAIGQMASKASNFHRKGDLGSLASARMLARKLFLTLSDVYPPRSHLIIEGMLMMIHGYGIYIFI